VKILTLDIETTPNLAHVWGLWQQNVALVQLRESTNLLCLAAKWHGDKNVHFLSGDEMLNDVFGLLDEADAVITWNGDRFDLPHLNREFLEHNMGIPSPYASIDLLKTSRKKFKFPSNKLDYVASTLGVGSKTSHYGHKLWIDCMAGDERAWKLMEKYNKQDVRITEKVYDKLLPWISSHPSVAAHAGNMNGCPNCGSVKAQKRGFAYTAVSTFQQFACLSCGKWYRGAKRLATTDARAL
jgi:DNA polymerase elongation subunit (family B)